jgi:hypothetical protein
MGRRRGKPRLYGNFGSSPLAQSESLRFGFPESNFAQKKTQSPRKCKKNLSEQMANDPKQSIQPLVVTLLVNRNISRFTP